MKKLLTILGVFSIQFLMAQTDKVLSLTVTEPPTEVAISLVENNPATAFGFTNGSIVVDISGGTPHSDGSYSFSWVNGSGNAVNGATAQVIGSVYRLTLDNIGADTYTLTVRDANYGGATNKGGCTHIEVFTVTQPPELTLSLVPTHISCSLENASGNQNNDGMLVAMAEGGVKFDPPVAGFYDYKFTWKKKNNSGVWEVLSGEIADKLTNLEAGEYAVNIEDANGIIIGIYSSDFTTVTPTDVTETLVEPDPIQINLSKTDVFCHDGSDGTITTTITGGNGGYTVQWNNLATTQNLTGLTAGTYTIEVTDSKGCSANASIEITEPENPIKIDYTFFEPTIAGATNGWIKATITGGTPLTDGSYTFLWEDSMNTNLQSQVSAVINSDSYELTLNDLGAGDYFLTIQDANYPLATDEPNCTIENSKYALDDPEPLTASIAVQTPISCHSSNTYGDPASDGVLVCNADGGVRLQPDDNGGLPYYYEWKKETSPGIWTVLTSQTTDVATGLDAGNYAVNIEDANGIVIGVYQNNVLVNATDVTFQFDEPALLELSLTKQDVYCHLGSDGWAEATITGGTPPYTTTWSNNETTTRIEDLGAGTYTVNITDSRGCQVSGNIDILQPTDPLEITYVAFSRPSTGGASDAVIQAQITGGTALTDGSYTYTWKDSSGTSLNAQTNTSFVGPSNDIYQVELTNIPSGTYTLSVEDANYNSATTKDGCIIIDNEFTIYDPIEATLEVFIPISCNQLNTFVNPSSDGQLLATVTGGLPFETGQPYIYHWKKQDDSGNYIDLPSQTGEIASNLSAGNYALNVEDSLGNIIGVYDSFTLVNATDVPIVFEEPDLLEVSFTSTEISCDAGNDGTATVNISGGIPPYDIEWSTGASSPTISNLIAGTYLVRIIDGRGCEATGQVEIYQPGGLEIAVVQQNNPTCYLGSDGQISLSVSGGEPPYTYLWNNGNTTTTLSNLEEGSYTFQITDSQGCTAFAVYELHNPDPIIVDLGEDRTLCNGQEHILDISIDDSGATYLWESDNGFTSQSGSVSLTETGTYTATLTTGLGCIGTDTIVISSSDVDIDSQFLITSQAFAEEEIILINTSSPISDVVEWMLPEEAVVIEQSNETITLRFDAPGAYEVNLRSFQGECFQDYSKPIVVEEARDLPDIGDSETPFIQEFMVFPNPNSGQFTVKVDLSEQSPISLRLYSLISNTPYDDRLLEGSDSYETSYSINVSYGVYFLLLETSKKSEIRKIIIR